MRRLAPPAAKAAGLWVRAPPLQACQYAFPISAAHGFAPPTMPAAFADVPPPGPGCRLAQLQGAAHAAGSLPPMPLADRGFRSRPPYLPSKRPAGPFPPEAGRAFRRAARAARPPFSPTADCRGLARHTLIGGVAHPCVSTVQQEFDAGAILLGLYKDLPYIKKVGYSIGEMAGRILVRVITDDSDCSDDESFANFIMSVRKAGEFEDMMPAGMRDEYEVVPIVTDPYEGALRHFRTMTAVIDR